VPGAVHCNLSSIWTVFSMEGELQSPLHRAALGFALDVGGAMGSSPGDRIRSVSQEMRMVQAAAQSVWLGKSSSMTKEYWQVIDADLKLAVLNFSTELSHLKLRSSVRRISVPSQIAEVSS
jgi:hypothetical protein